MLRWTLLLTCFGAWVASLALVYAHYGPREAAVQMPGTQAALDAVFDDNAETLRAWHIFVDPTTLPSPSADSAPAKPWDGVDETHLIEVGWIETSLKRKNDARAEQTTTLNIGFPHELNMPMLEALGRLTYTSWSDISADDGLEYFSSLLETGIVDVNTFGNRNGNELNVTMELQHNHKSLFQRRMKFPLNGKAAPSVDLTPFQHQNEIKTGLNWDIVMLDTSGGVSQLMAASSSATPKMVFLKATCTGERKINFQGHPITALEVTTPGNASQAWYAPDGRVLKEKYRIADMLEVILVRADPKQRGHGLRIAHEAQAQIEDVNKGANP